VEHDTNYGQNASGSSENQGGDLGVMHSVTLTSLTPDSTYHYRVGGAGDWSEDHIFYTAPSDVCMPFSFGIAADNRGDFSGSSGCWPQVYQAIADQGCSFVLNTGDLVNEGKNESEWVDFLDKSEPLMDEIPLMGCIGNHDDDDTEGDTALYNKIFAFPRNSSNNFEDFYSFDYGNVHFVALSTHSFSGNHLEVQRAWLEQDLAATDRMWKVIYFHQPIYSSGSHGSDEDGNNWSSPATIISTSATSPSAAGRRRPPTTRGSATSSRAAAGRLPIRFTGGVPRRIIGRWETRIPSTTTCR
jgi:hypothetical protein